MIQQKKLKLCENVGCLQLSMGGIGNGGENERV